jgi:hypothetical protein
MSEEISEVTAVSAGTLDDVNIEDEMSRDYTE